MDNTHMIPARPFNIFGRMPEWKSTLTAPSMLTAKAAKIKKCSTLDLRSSVKRANQNSNSEMKIRYISNHMNAIVILGSKTPYFNIINIPPIIKNNSTHFD
jgi:hypothetical protein